MATQTPPAPLVDETPLRVRLVHLNTKSLNGELGLRTTYIPAKKRYVVLLDNGTKCQVRPRNLSLLPPPKPNTSGLPNDLQMALSMDLKHTIDRLKHARQNRLDPTITDPKHKKFAKVKCPICNTKQVKLTCSRCKVRRYCSQECQRQDWKAHKIYCRKPSAEETKETILQGIWDEWQQVADKFWKGGFEMKLFPTKTNIIEQSIQDLSAEMAFDAMMAAQNLKAAENIERPPESVLLNPPPALLERTIIKLLENVKETFPVEVHAMRERVLAEENRRNNDQGATEKEIIAARLAQPAEEQQFLPLLKEWKGSLAASRSVLQRFPMWSSPQQAWFQVPITHAGGMTISFSTFNASMDSNSGLMWYIVNAAGGAWDSYNDKGGAAICLGAPKQLVCEKKLFDFIYKRKLLPKEVKFAHRWGLEIAQNVGAMLKTLGIQWRLEPYKEAIQSALRCSTHPMGLNYPGARLDDEAKDYIKKEAGKGNGLAIKYLKLRGVE